MRLHRPRNISWLLIFVLGLTLLWLAPGMAQEGTDEETLQEGALLYNENCLVCHGPEGRGRIGATLDKDWPSIRPDLQIEATISRGVSGSVMPAWSQDNGGPLTQDEIDALVAYILSWETNGEILILPTSTALPRAALTPPPDVSGDPNDGAVLYEHNCQVCHGAEGRGRIGATLNKDWPSIRPDLQIQATISRGVSGSVMPAWSQDNGGPLTNDDIDNLVAYILTWSTQENPPTVTAAAPTPVANTNEGLSPQTLVLLAIIAVVLIGGAAYYSLRNR